MTKLSGLNLVCADVDATLAFYGLLGLPAVADDAVWRSERDDRAHHVSGDPIEFDSVDLARAYNRGYAGGPTLLDFGVASRDAVDDAYRRLTDAGYEGRQPPCDAFWGARFAVVADPDGRDVGIMSPRDPDRHAAPPDL